jgi:hypothetical protein
MAKPAITKYGVKGSPLTTSELDTNFQNLTDATVTLTAGSGGTAVSADLNGTITLVAGTNITLTGNNTAKTITITSSGGSGLSNVVEDTTPQLGGNLDVQSFSLISSTNTIGLSATQVDFNNSIARSMSLKDAGYVFYNAGSVTGTFTPVIANGNVQQITLSGSVTIDSFSSAIAGQFLTLIIKQPNTGGPYTLTSTMKFEGGSKTLSTAANAIDIIDIYFTGADYYATLRKAFA